jgi:hypothetical protein
MNSSADSFESSKRGITKSQVLVRSAESLAHNLSSNEEGTQKRAIYFRIVNEERSSFCDALLKPLKTIGFVRRNAQIRPISKRSTQSMIRLARVKNSASPLFGVGTGQEKEETPKKL